MQHNHECYIQPKEAKLPLKSGQMRFFDFECTISPDGGVHTPNYAAVTHDGVHVTEYFQEGHSILESFVRTEFSEANRGCVFIAHNARAYDAQFVKAELLRQGIAFELIPNGRKIMLLTIPRLHIRLIDSLNFIPAPLSLFPKLFALEGIRKGVYPYQFNQTHTWSYKGPVPDLQYFLPEGISPDDLTRPIAGGQRFPVGTDMETDLRAKLLDIKAWHDELLEEKYVWDNARELRAYGRTDVLLGMRGILKFRDNFMKMTAQAWGATPARGTPCVYPLVWCRA